LSPNRAQIEEIRLEFWYRRILVSLVLKVSEICLANLQNILSSADKKADEALAGLDQGTKDGAETADAEAPSVGEKASDAAEKTKANTGQAWESTKQGTTGAAEKTKDSTGQAWESTKQGTSDATEATKEKAVQAKDESASLLQKVNLETCQYS